MEASANAPALGEPLYVDNHILVVVKPPGLLAQSDRTGDPDLASLAKAYLKERFQRPGDVFVGIVHRLDRPASGVTVLARTSKAAARLTAAFRERRVEKRYLAIVEGHLEGEGARTDAIRKVGERIRLVAPGTPGAKEAAMRWRALAGAGGHTLVEVELLTGRPHQARLQLAALGTPILGDFRHGAREPFAGGKWVALHAWRLAFPHPVRDVDCAFEAPPPAAWVGLFDDEVRALVPAVKALIDDGPSTTGQ